MATGESTGTVPGTTNPVEVVRFSPDGNYFAVAGWDGMVIIWSTETENHVTTLGSPGGGILAMAFTPDSKHLAIGTDTGLLRVWQFPNLENAGYAQSA